MGLSYVIMSFALGLGLVVLFNFVVRFSGTTQPVPAGVNLDSLLGLMIVPFAAMVGLIITTPVYLLFVNDKNVGVLEYLLAVGMDQREIFWGYLKAAILLSAAVSVPMVALNAAISQGGATMSLIVAVLGLATGVADVALVTVLMTAYSAMQRRPTGMNQPVGISVGILIILPEFFLIALVRDAIVWVDGAVALAMLVVALAMVLSLGRVIRREKLLP